MGVRKNDAIGTMDFETDPFKIGRVPFPFACGIYFSRNDYSILWESDSRRDFLDRCISALRRLPSCTLYAHNGGRFDFHYLLEYAEQRIIIRNGRVSEMQIGNVTLKDSFPLMPFALEEFRKTPINYDLFESNKRERHRAKIESYLLDDCADLHELVTGFRSIVGPKDTIASAAFYQMKRAGIEIQSLNETHDEMFRPFFYGGRVQAFEKGIFHGTFRYIDVNSAYPDAMRQDHPHGANYIYSNRLPAPNKIGSCFVRCLAYSNGALPFGETDAAGKRTGALSFPIRNGEFFATGWEIAAGIQTKTLVIDKVLDVWKPLDFINHREYVDSFYALRLAAKRAKDPIKKLAYKYLLNSGYGKYAQNPRDFREYCLAEYGVNVPGFDWENDFGNVSLWSKPSYTSRGFYDVATAASITGYQRAKLWTAICASRRVLYCDTDAIMCEKSTIPTGEKLGEWKLEGLIKTLPIGGKKLYGIEWHKPYPDNERYKIVSKGARLTWRELLDVCNGKRILWRNAAPTFSINGTYFVRRRINAT